MTFVFKPTRYIPVDPILADERCDIGPLVALINAGRVRGHKNMNHQYVIDEDDTEALRQGLREHRRAKYAHLVEEAIEEMHEKAVRKK